MQITTDQCQPMPIVTNDELAADTDGTVESGLRLNVSNRRLVALLAQTDLFKGVGNGLPFKGKMAGIIEKAAGILKRTWECKQCHQDISEERTVAYHLIDGILYGWCESCFSQRAQVKRAIASQAA